MFLWVVLVGWTVGAAVFALWGLRRRNSPSEEAYWDAGTE